MDWAEGLVTAGPTLIAGLGGGLIGGWLTRKATIEGIRQAHTLQQEAADRAEENLIQGFIWSVYEELSVLRDAYMASVGIAVETSKHDEPLEFVYPTHDGFFAVYNNSSHMVGRLKDGELRRKIISTYTHTKDLLDSFEENNKQCLELVNHQKYYIGNEEKYDPRIKEQLLEQMGSYANGIREQHSSTKAILDDLLAYIEENTSKLALQQSEDK